MPSETLDVIGQVGEMPDRGVVFNVEFVVELKRDVHRIKVNAGTDRDDQENMENTDLGCAGTGHI